MVARTSSLSHIMLCAGSVTEWAATSAAQWQERITLVAHAAKVGGAEWATIVPSAQVDNKASVANAEIVKQLLVDECNGVRYGERIVVLSEGGVTVIVDPTPDGKERIVRAANQVANASDITEDRLTAAVSAPAPHEPDLVIILGSPTQMPPSLVWELAYAELVFFDAPWHGLDAEHLEMAVDDFTRRDRRFGGVDS